MLKKIDDLNFYELLEVGPDANAQDIHKAYDRVRKVYEPQSIALYSLLSTEETERIRHRIDEAYRTLIYEETRREYDRMLQERHELPEPAPPKPRYQPFRTAPVPARPYPVTEIPQQASLEIPAPGASPAESKPAPQAAPMQGGLQPPPASITEFTGSAIRFLREQRGLSLQQVADFTKVSSRHLQHIEEEAYLKLPARPYLHGFLTLYAKALGYEPERIVGDYMKRYKASTAAKTR